MTMFVLSSRPFSAVGNLETKLSDLKRSVLNMTERVSFHSSKLPKKGWSIFNVLLMVIMDINISDLSAAVLGILSD